MTPEERWQRIEEAHLTLAESLELYIHAMQDERIAMQDEQREQAHRDRILREALLSGVAAFLQALGRPPEAG